VPRGVELPPSLTLYLHYQYTILAVYLHYTPTMLTPYLYYTHKNAKKLNCIHTIILLEEVSYHLHRYRQHHCHVPSPQLSLIPATFLSAIPIRHRSFGCSLLFISPSRNPLSLFHFSSSFACHLPLFSYFYLFCPSLGAAAAVVLLSSPLFSMRTVLSTRNTSVHTRAHTHTQTHRYTDTRTHMYARAHT
jgi:hypothetical protein